VAAQPLGVVGAAGEEVEQLVGGQVGREGREPDLQPGRRRGAGGGLEPLQVAAGDPDGVAVQVVVDDAQLAGDDLGVEGLVGADAPVEEAGVVADAPCRAWTSSAAGQGRVRTRAWTGG
jgi:hypothetical protein